MSYKDAYYFSHDSNARQDEKIIALRMKLGWEGYGLYWALIEKLRDATNYMCVKDYNLIAFDLRSDAAKIKSIIEEFGLFAFTINETGECFYSMSLIKRMTQFDSAKAKLSVSGIKGNLIKNKHITKAQAASMNDDEILELNEKIKGNNGGGSGAGRETTANKGKESKGDKSKEKEIEVYRQFLHLSISVEDFDKLIETGYSKEQIDSILESIENYGPNKKYKSLFITAKNWLKKDFGVPKTKEEQVVIENETEEERFHREWKAKNKTIPMH
ncbi:uncharacterized protein DUF4373 [Chryseobacterium sp. 7]|uniref:Lin1244/Lin1753 domain-containing protein n=1 Tax=Chryseobacterium sp. 7 TaxID=2035214 RepID=UPI000EB51F5B|nr:Lin1244/Lin1753 domain-containing protein [Chryseobacterium sp. 7]RLJ34153.1 uncharacterized protein DUF4373 [Chryseobacterium sp. 7]